MARTATEIHQLELGKLLIRLAELEAICEKQAEEIAALKQPARPVLTINPNISTTQTATGRD